MKPGEKRAEKQPRLPAEEAPAGRVIVVDDEPNMCKLLKLMLEKVGHEVSTTDDGREVLKRVAEDPTWDVVIQDVKMPKMEGLELLEGLQALENPPFVLVITAFSSWEDAVKAMRLGAYDYIKKPFENEYIKNVVAHAVRRRRLFARSRAEGVRTVPQTGDIIGDSPGIREVMRVIGRIAPTDSTVLIRGESGTGKELVARAIHYNSFRTHEPFIPVNCGALTESLLESELFGHVKGAFTGATADKKGLLAIADGGTFFLDEIGEMSASTQVKLLRVLEDREVRPVGSVKNRLVNVRFITATNQDLEKLVSEGRFREDLYYRLNVIPMFLPPLRERKEDIPLLANHFLARCAARMGKTIVGIDEDAMEYLRNSDWPGNVREVENTVERAVALAEGEEITRRDILMLGPGKESARRAAAGERPGIPPEGVNLERELEEVERRYIGRALEETGGNLTKAAELLGMSFRSIRYKVKKLGIERSGRGSPTENQKP